MFVQQLIQRPPPPMSKTLVHNGGFRTPRSHMFPHLSNGLIEPVPTMGVPMLPVADRPTSLGVNPAAHGHGNNGDQPVMYYPQYFNTISSGYQTPPSGLVGNNPAQLQASAAPSPQPTPSPTPLTSASAMPPCPSSMAPQLPGSQTAPPSVLPGQVTALPSGPVIPPGPTDSPHSGSPQPQPPLISTMPHVTCNTPVASQCTCNTCTGSNSCSSSSSNSSNMSSNGGAGDRGSGVMPPYNPRMLTHMSMPRNGMTSNQTYAAYMHAALSADWFYRTGFTMMNPGGQHNARYLYNAGLTAQHNAAQNYMMHQRRGLSMPYNARHKTVSHPTCHNCGQSGHLAHECHEKPLEHGKDAHTKFSESNVYLINCIREVKN